MLRVIIAWSLLAVSVIGSGVAVAWGPLRDLPDQIVQTPIGQLSLGHLRVDQSMGSVFLLGEVTNKTDRAWNELVLSVAFKDKNGEIALRASSGDAEQPALFVHLHDLTPGATQKFSIHGFAKADKATAATAVNYSDGRFPVVYRVGLVKPVTSDNLAFETDRYALVFSLDDKGVRVRLNNKADVPTRIDWNTVAYVDVAGQSQSVIHNGVRPVERTAPKAPTIVPPGASIEDDIVPVNNIESVNMQWVTHSLLPTGPAGCSVTG